MNRTVLAVDRMATLVAGLLVTALGGVALIWWVDLWPALSGQFDLSTVRALTDRSWWTWACGATGALLILLGARWLIVHIPGRGVSLVRLPGSGIHGRLTAAADPVAGAGAEVLNRSTGVRAVRSGIHRHRGQLVIRLDVTIEPDTDLGAVARAADGITADYRDVRQREDPHCLVYLRTARRGRSLPRVH